MFQFDELDSLISGIQFIEAHNSKELYFWENPADDKEAVKRAYDFSNPYPFMLVNIGSGVSILYCTVLYCTVLYCVHLYYTGEHPVSAGAGSVWAGVRDLSRGRHLPRPLLPSHPGKLSLSCHTSCHSCLLLTQCTTFEEALELAAKGDNKKVDKLGRVFLCDSASG